MSVSYGQPPAAPQPGSTSPSGGLDLGKILALATGGLGLVLYFLSFADDAGTYLRGLMGVLLLGGGLLAAASVLPKAPATLLPATVMVITGTLFLLIDVAKGPFLLSTSGVTVPGLAIVALILAFLESASGVLALLVTAGLVNLNSRSGPFPQRSWEPQQPGGYPGPGAQAGYPAPGGYSGQGGYPGPNFYSGQTGHPAQGGYPGPDGYPGHGGYPGQGGYPAPGGYPAQGGYPGQYQPAGQPPSGYPVQAPQPYMPETVQYRSLQDQYGQYGGGQPGQGQYGSEPQGRYGGGEEGPDSAERAEPERERDERPETPPDSPAKG
ncbi:MAG: DUF5336 domain-containing protein [Pseudonocardiaceae bacterium]